jgi:hypothetical protein
MLTLWKDALWVRSSGVGVRVGQAQLRLRRAGRRDPLLRQRRGRRDEEEGSHPEDERDVALGEDARPHHGAPLQSVLGLSLSLCRLATVR